MKTLVVYDSVYGNTEKVARAIDGALPGEVQVLPVGRVDVGLLAAVDLLIVGSPTQGSLPTRPIQELLEKVGLPARAGARAAAFDTRLTWRFLDRWGFAADRIAAALGSRGWTLAGTQGGFVVRGLKRGPLRPGEVERAAAWAKELVP